MKKLFSILGVLALTVGLFGADAANDVVLSQRKADNSGFIQRNVAPTASGFLTFNASKVPTSPADLTYATPTLGVPDAFNISSAGSIDINAGGSNKNIRMLPSGSGATFVGSNLGYIPTSLTQSAFNVSGSMGVYTTGFSAGISFYRVNTSFSAPTAIASGSTISAIRSGGYNGTSYTDGATVIGAQSSEAWTNTTTGANLFFQTTNTGQTTIQNRVQILAAGTLVTGVAAPLGGTPAWGVSGIVTRSTANTIIDSNSATGTVASAVFNSFAVPTINATNANVVYTNLANVYIAGDVATTGNASATNSYGLWNVGKTRLDAPIVRTPSTLTYASPTSVNVALASFYTVTTVNATGSVTFNATAAGTSGQMLSIIITNDATSAKTITFGTNFTANGTLTASGVSKKTTIQFISDGTAFIEVSRTVLP